MLAMLAMEFGRFHRLSQQLEIVSICAHSEFGSLHVRCKGKAWVSTSPHKDL